MSLLLLVFVGVPLKYLLAAPEVVRVLGPVHGALFVLYLVLLAEALAGGGGAWPPRRVITAVGASFVPFGTFVLLGPVLDGPASREPRGGAERHA